MTNRAQTALRIIEKTNGHLFSVVFIKKDGTPRKMVARTGVKKGVTGVGMKYAPVERGLLPVWDVQKGEWRMVNLETTVRLRANKVTYNIVV